MDIFKFKWNLNLSLHTWFKVLTDLNSHEARE